MAFPCITIDIAHWLDTLYPALPSSHNPSIGHSGWVRLLVLGTVLDLGELTDAERKLIKDIKRPTMSDYRRFPPPERIDVSKLTKVVDPEPHSYLTVAPETPQERERLIEHRIRMERGKAFDRRIRLLVLETGPSILAVFIVVAVTVLNLVIVSPWGRATVDEKDIAASQLRLILTGTIAFVFGRATDPKFRD
jgi:hypothetical protein